MEFKILFSNIGYARGIDGSLQHHISRFSHYFYCPLPVQRDVINQARELIRQENPDLCCFVEIENRQDYNHIQELAHPAYRHMEVAGKYGAKTLHSRLPFHSNKGNGLIAKQPLPTQKFFLKNGIKKLVYRVELPGDITLFFLHLSLLSNVRARQILEIGDYIRQTEGETLLMADFNILNGPDELAPLLKEGHLHLLNDISQPTFTFHYHRLMLDLAICSSALKERISLKVIPQPYSDHAALLASISYT